MTVRLAITYEFEYFNGKVILFLLNYPFKSHLENKCVCTHIYNCRFVYGMGRLDMWMHKCYVQNVYHKKEDRRGTIFLSSMSSHINSASYEKKKKKIYDY